MSDLRIFSRSGDLVARTVGDETVLVPVRNSVGNLDSVFTLTPVAARVWQLLDGEATVDAIVGRLCDEYEVERAVVDADVADLLETLEAANLVRGLATAGEGR
jgi:hypothetical protein